MMEGHVTMEGCMMVEGRVMMEGRKSIAKQTHLNRHEPRPKAWDVQQEG